jgi:branched-chain amino acid transport system ATP-binding protein
MNLLRLQSVSRNFGELLALDRVSLELKPGELHAVIGPNGAGKTTLFNLISGFMAVTSGDIYFQDRRINRLTAERRTTLGIVRTFQVTEIFRELTVFENLRVGIETAAGYNPLPWLRRAVRRHIRQQIDELMNLAGITKFADCVAGELAHGDQRVVEIALALSLRPKVLLLDEPTAGMAEHETEAMVALIRRIHKEQSMSLLFIEHDMEVVFGIAHRITVLDYGRVLASGTPEEIADNSAVQKAYLGEAA